MFSLYFLIWDEMIPNSDEMIAKLHIRNLIIEMQTREYLLWGKAQYLLIKVACLVKNKKIFLISNGVNLIYLVQGGQPYWAFPFSKTSMIRLAKSMIETHQNPKICLISKFFILA